MIKTFGLTSLILIAGFAASASAQNEVQNGGFTSDLSGWQVLTVEGATTWSSRDADGSPSSGSALASSTAAAAGSLQSNLRQCVAVIPGASYVVSMEALFAGGQATSGNAELSVYWTPSATCEGFISGNGIQVDSTIVSADTWNPVTQTFMAPGGALGAVVQLGVEKFPAGGSFSANFDKIGFAPVGGGDVLVGYLPGAGSGNGSHGSHFKSSGQTTNPGATPITVRLVYHPAGKTASDGDPHTSFIVGPGATVSSDDFVASLGQTGLGTVDIFSTLGGPTPLVIARVYNDAGAAGTTGFSEALVVPQIPVGGTAILIGPSDVTKFRFNIGVRTFAAPVTLTINVKDSDGNVVHSQTTGVAAGFFQQYSSHDFLNGFDIGPNSTIVIQSDGQVLFFGAGVDDITNDPSVQFVIAR